jgi:hypothetical protein
MTIKSRLIKLESMTSDEWEPFAITFNIRDCRKVAEPIPIDAYELSVSGHKTIIDRRPDESEAAFVIRATKIRDLRVVRPRDRHDIPPTPIMIQIVERKQKRCSAIEGHSKFIPLPNS